MNRIVIILMTFATLNIGACSWISFPGVHKVPIQQGNIVTQEMVDKLKPGMTRSQVRFVMGTPLVVNTFDQDRWDYIYSIKLANDKILKTEFSVFFEDDILSHTKGDYTPSSSEKLESEAS